MDGRGELAQLKRLHAKRLPDEEIARRIGRSRTSVSGKIITLRVALPLRRAPYNLSLKQKDEMRR